MSEIDNLMGLLQLVTSASGQQPAQIRKAAEALLDPAKTPLPIRSNSPAWKLLRNVIDSTHKAGSVAGKERLLQSLLQLHGYVMGERKKPGVEGRVQERVEEASRRQQVTAKEEAAREAEVLEKSRKKIEAKARAKSVAKAKKEEATKKKVVSWERPEPRELSHAEAVAALDAEQKLKLEREIANRESLGRMAANPPIPNQPPGAMVLEGLKHTQEQERVKQLKRDADKAKAMAPEMEAAAAGAPTWQGALKIQKALDAAQKGLADAAKMKDVPKFTALKTQVESLTKQLEVAKAGIGFGGRAELALRSPGMFNIKNLGGLAAMVVLPQLFSTIMDYVTRTRGVESGLEAGRVQLASQVAAQRGSVADQLAAAMLQRETARTDQARQLALQGTLQAESMGASSVDFRTPLE
jgi:hypothetical protein